MLKAANWYAVRTRSNREYKVRSLLCASGIENYLPSFYELHQWKDRKKVVELPLFAGYLFARIPDSPLSRLAVLRTEGVVAILGHGQAIDSIPDHEIECLKQFLESRTQVCVHPLLREGAWVRVKRGSLSGLEGLLLRIKDKTRLVISITVLSHSVSAEIDANDVEFCRRDSRRQVA